MSLLWFLPFGCGGSTFGDEEFDLSGEGSDFFDGGRDDWDVTLPTSAMDGMLLEVLAGVDGLHVGVHELMPGSGRRA